MGNFSLGEAVLGTGVDLTGLKEGLGDAKGAASSGVDQLAGIFSTGLKMATGAVLAGGLALAGMFSYAFGEALEGEQNLVRLEQVITSTGGQAGVTSEYAQELANQFKNLAGGSDDAILAIEEIGLRAGTVSKEDFPAFIQSSLDLGAVMGDNAAAAELLARAQEDPLAALSKLTKAGVVFTAEQEAQVKALVDAGDTAGALEIIMGRLAEATGGAAAANAGTLAGQWEIFKGTLAEAAETVGSAFLPVAHELFDSVIAPAIPILESLASQFATGVPGAIDTAKAKFAELQPTFQPVIDAATGLANIFGSSMPMVQQTVGEMAAFVQGQFAILFPTLIANVTASLNTIAAFWTAHGAQIMGAIQTAFAFITVTIGGALTLASGFVSVALTTISGYVDIFSALLRGDWQGAWDAVLLTLTTVAATLTSTLATFMSSVLSMMGTDLESFTSIWKENLEMAQTIVETVLAQIITAVTGKVGEFINAGAALISGIQQGVEDAVQGLINSVVAAVQAALAAAQDAMGIHSPSDVAAEMLGLPLAQGMAQGILSGMPEVMLAMQAVSTAGLTDARHISVDARGATLTTTQIRGVVDRALREAGNAGDVRIRLGE